MVWGRGLACSGSRSLSWWEGHGSAKGHWCQVQPRLSRNRSLMRLQGEKTVLVLVCFYWEVDVTCKLPRMYIDTYSTFIEDKSVLIEFFWPVDSLECILIELKRCEQFISLSLKDKRKLHFIFFFCLSVCVFRLLVLQKVSRYFWIEKSWLHTQIKIYNS